MSKKTDEEKKFGEQVGKNIDNLMREKGISRTELAMAIDVTNGTITKYLQGDSRIPSYILFKIADYLKVSVYELISIQEHCTENDIKKIIYSLHKLSASLRNNIETVELIKLDIEHLKHT